MIKQLRTNNNIGNHTSRSQSFKAKKAFLVLFLLMTISSFAAHFRSGSITATRLSETATTVTYKLNYSSSWRLGTAGGNPTFTVSGGNNTYVTIPTTTVTDPSGAWSNSVGTANVTLNKTSVLTRIEWIGCCKISTISNNRDTNWDVFTIINTSAPGSSPVSTLPAVINMPINALAATYALPASDPDPGSTLTFGTPSFTGGLAGQSEPSGFSINSTTGVMTLNTVGKTIGQQYNAMVTVTDNSGNMILIDFLINMVGQSSPPVFDYAITPANGYIYNVIAGQNVSFPISASDNDAGSSVSLSIAGLPSYITTANFSNNPLPATANPSLTTFSWTPTGAQIGNTIVLNIIATDNVGVQASTSVTIRVVAEPAPVFISPTPIQGQLVAIETGNLYSQSIVASSALNSNVSIAFATGIPSGAVLSPSVPTLGADPGQTQINWTPVPSDFGLHTFTFQATISAFPTIFATRSFQVTVNTLPEFSSLPLTSVLVNQFYSYDVTVSDLNIPYGDIINIVGAGIPSWLTLVSTGNGTAVLSGTPSVSNIGLNPVHIEAEDLFHHSNSLHVEQEFDINVIEPTPVAICQDITASLDASGNLVISANQIDNGSYSFVEISSMTVTPSVFDCTSIGRNQVNLVVTNRYGNSSTCQAFVTVIDAIAPVAIAQDITVQLDASGNGSITASQIDNGSNDACGIALMTIDNSSFTCSNVGSDNPVVLTVTDVNGNVATANAIVTVIDAIAPVLSSNGNINVNNDLDVCGAIVVVSATVSDNCTVGTSVGVRSDAFALTDIYPVGTTTVTWNVSDNSGNGAVAVIQTVTVTDNQAPVIVGTPSNISQSSDAGNCSANVRWTTATVIDNCDGATISSNYKSGDIFPLGTTTVTFTSKDAAGNDAELTNFTVTVTDDEKPIWFSGNTSLNRSTYCGSNAADLINAQELEPIATDNCTGLITISKTLSGSFISTGPGGAGTYTNTWTATDVAGNVSDVFTQVITIIGVSIDASASNSTLAVNTPTSLYATVSPAVAGISVTFYLDGTNLGTVSTTSSGLATLPILGLPTEVYLVKAIAGNGCAASLAYLAVYDPNGGFVTGGGWIMSPAGAYLADITLTSKANFGFVAKYKKGSTQVDGNTEFQFHAGNLNFKSSSHAAMSLVIAGAQAIYKGQGSINGFAGYSFMTSAIDGNKKTTVVSDKFRIKIWVTATGAIVYDNQNGVGDNEDATAALGGGSIVIHEVKKNTTAKVESVKISSEPSTFNVIAYPNPTKQQFTLVVEGGSNEKIDVIVYDILGRTVKQIEKSEGQQVLFGEELPAGTYFTIVSQGENQKMVRLIKQ